MGLLAVTALKAAPKEKIIEPDGDRLDDHDLALTLELEIDQGLVGTAQHLPRLLAGRIEREHAAEAGQGIVASLEIESRCCGAPALAARGASGVVAAGADCCSGVSMAGVSVSWESGALTTRDFDAALVGTATFGMETASRTGMM